MAMAELTPLWKDFTYFAHQRIGIEWMLDKESVGTDVPLRSGDGMTTVYGGLQCDEMGLGKTIQMVGVMVQHPLPVTLLLAPLAMTETWTSVCQRAGFVVYHAEQGVWVRKRVKAKANAKAGKEEDVVVQRQTEDGKECCVYVANHEKLYTATPMFREQWFDRVVIDEAHKIRSGDGQLALYARKLKTRIRWALTGTPLVNAFSDIVSLLAFLGVPYLRTWRWERRYEEVLPKLLIHRTLESVRSVLADAPPEPLVHHLRLPFATEKEAEFYYGVQGLSAGMDATLEGLSGAGKFLLLLRLRQISVHPQVYIRAKRRLAKSYERPDWTEPSTKMLALREILECDRDRDRDRDSEVHKYIVFCQFNDEMELLRDYLYTLGFDANHVLMYDGTLSEAQRTAVLAHSKATVKPTVLLLQIQAGGVGLNLQEYDRIIFISPWWTAALTDQAVARAVRMGQKRVVEVYHLELEVEHENIDMIRIDELVDQKAQEKRVLLDHIFHLCDRAIAAEQASQEEEEEQAVSEAEEEEAVSEAEEEEEAEPGSTIA